MLDVYGYGRGQNRAGGRRDSRRRDQRAQARLKLILALGVASGRDELAVFSTRRDRFHERQTGKLKMAQAIPRHLLQRIGKTGRNGPESLTWARVEKPHIFPGPLGLWAFHCCCVCCHYPVPTTGPWRTRNLPCRTSAGCREPFMSYPRALTRPFCVCCCARCCWPVRKGPRPGSSVRASRDNQTGAPAKSTTALAGRIASFQVAEVRPQVGGNKNASSVYLPRCRREGGAGPVSDRSRRM